MKKDIKLSHIVRNVIFCLLIVGLLAILTGPAMAADKAEEEALVNDALTTFNQFMADKDMGYLKDHLKDSKGIIIVPSLIKGGFVFGASGGHGVLLVRDEKTGAWSEPAFYTIGAVSFGLLGGIQKSEVI